MLGDPLVVIGVEEVRYDESRRKWQPDYHLMACGGELVNLWELKTKLRCAERTGPRSMKRSCDYSRTRQARYTPARNRPPTLSYNLRRSGLMLGSLLTKRQQAI